MNRDEIKGKARNIKGRIKEAWSSVTRSKRVQEGIGRVKRDIDRTTTPEEKKP